MSKYIEELFKENPPSETIARIKDCLRSVGIVLDEKIRDAGIGDCYSVHVSVANGYPFFTNGKGVSRDLALASAYGEFIERLQCGLFLYKFQSISRDKDVDYQSYAPDARYMSLDELQQCGAEWMDPIIQTYGPELTRKKLAEQCKMYACTDDDQILTIPFYSLFEDKYVYLPAGFVEHMYSANGCCAGNTRDEAWIHGFSEIMERHNTVRMITTGCSAPEIPQDIIDKFPVPSRLLKAIRAHGQYDITLFDFSDGSGFPVVGTRIINKENQDYLLNSSADPVFEIALSRCLTEIFQGRDINTVIASHIGEIMNKTCPIPMSHNVLNQIETGNGLLSVDFFSEEFAEQRFSKGFADNSKKTNQQLLQYILDLFKGFGKPVYIRNYSYLGFPSYQIVVPGFSETRGLRLTENPQQYGLGDIACKTLRNPKSADLFELSMLLAFFNKMQSAISRRQNFAGLAGLPMQGSITHVLLYNTLAFTAYKLGKYADAAVYLNKLLAIKYKDEDPLDAEERLFFKCIIYWLNLKAKKADDKRIGVILPKLFPASTAARLEAALQAGKTPFDQYLLSCDPHNCNQCPYRNICNYEFVRNTIKKAGQVYNQFENGQDPALFKI